MLTLTQSASVRGSAGDPLPEVWENLAESGTQFRRGQLALVAAAPGVGKSAFVLNYALKSEVSCMYFSADSDAFVQLARALAILGGLDMSSAETMVRAEETERIADVIGDVPIRFSYNSSPTLQHIESQLLAYNELYGDFPELIVVDNALDVAIDTDEEQAQSLDALMAWLHDTARVTEACVIVLHHVTGPFNDANTPIPLSGVKGQIGRVPELILTLHKQTEGGDEVLCVSTVKNRGQRADASGNTFSELSFDGFRMSITDHVPVAAQMDNPFDAQSMYERGMYG